MGFVGTNSKYSKRQNGSESSTCLSSKILQKDATFTVAVGLLFGACSGNNIGFSG